MYNLLTYNSNIYIFCWTKNVLKNVNPLIIWLSSLYTVCMFCPTINAAVWYTLFTEVFQEFLYFIGNRDSISRNWNQWPFGGRNVANFLFYSELFSLRRCIGKLRRWQIFIVYRGRDNLRCGSKAPLAWWVRRIVGFRVKWGYEERISGSDYVRKNTIMVRWS